jgi:hypothetical protein
MKKEKAVKDKTEKKVHEVAVVNVGVPEQVSAYQQQLRSVENMIMQAIQQGTPVETLERVLAMREKLKAEYAEQKFIEAMSKFQMQCPIIKKTKKIT